MPIPPSSLGGARGRHGARSTCRGSPITIARADDRKALCQSQSLRCLAAYAYAAAGAGESTNDLSWDGQTMIYEGGTLLAETERFPDGPRRSASPTSTSIASARIASGRGRSTTTAARTTPLLPHRPLRARPAGARTSACGAPLDRFPFVPDDPARLAQDCYEAFNIQVSGLVQRMQRDRRPEARHRR